MAHEFDLFFMGFCRSRDFLVVKAVGVEVL